MDERSLEFEDLRARLELRALVEEYAAAGDAFDNDRYAACFTVDAEFVTTTPAMVVRGRDEIGRIPDINGVFEQTFHAVHNHHVEIHGDTATGITSCTARHLLRRDDGTFEVILTPIRYRDEYLRTEEGWKFTRREILFTWFERLTVDPTAVEAWTSADEAASTR
jgi:ketosteroid isomerase-like protein